MLPLDVSVFWRNIQSWMHEHCLTYCLTTCSTMLHARLITSHWLQWGFSQAGIRRPHPSAEEGSVWLFGLTGSQNKTKWGKPVKPSKFFLTKTKNAVIKILRLFKWPRFSRIARLAAFTQWQSCLSYSYYFLITPSHRWHRSKAITRWLELY